MVRDAVVVGSGPNGLAAAVTLARAGIEVTVIEGADGVGGGAATAELTEPGVLHDVCSAVHPMALASEFFRRFELADRVELLTPSVSYGHALTPERAVLAHRDLDATAAALGRDGDAWRRLFAPFVSDGGATLGEMIDGSLARMPEHPLALARFGLRALSHGLPHRRGAFTGDAAPALLAGVMAHTIQRMPSIGSSAAGLALASFAHIGGWPIVRGGSGAIIDALVRDLLAHGGRIETGVWVRDLAELPAARVTVLDVTPRAFLRMAGERLGGPGARGSRPYRRFRYGNAAAKADFVLSDPVPWGAEELREAVTVHVGGTAHDLATSEAQVAAGRHPQTPYVLTVQPTVLDASRAPGCHVLWAYMHVPAGSDRDPREAIVSRLERFAPGFRDTIVAGSARTAGDIEVHNPNDIGGDIASGAVSVRQLLARPVFAADPWRTPLPGVYLCSASTAPGPGVHGLGGWHAARSALRREFGIVDAPDLSIGA